MTRQSTRSFFQEDFVKEREELLTRLDTVLFTSLLLAVERGTSDTTNFWGVSAEERMCRAMRYCGNVDLSIYNAV